MDLFNRQRNSIEFTSTSDNNSVTPVLSEGDEILELGDNFNLEEYQVVRREFFAHLREPSIIFNNFKLYVNMACLSRFPDTEYVQILIDDDAKILALRPSREGIRDSFRWCYTSLNGKKKPKQLSGKIFSAKIIKLMCWESDFRYKMLGNVIHANGEYLLAFDLSATEIYPKIVKEGTKPITSKTPVFPLDWQNQFGLPLHEHKNSMQINIFDGFAIYSIKDNSVVTTPVTAESNAELVPIENGGGYPIGE